MPDLRGRDARPVRLAGRASDQGVHPAAHRRGRHAQPDQGRAGRECGHADPRRAAAARVRPARLAAADRRRARRRGGARRARLALDPRARAGAGAAALVAERAPARAGRGAPARRGARPLRWAERIAAAFAAGLVSIAFPCVLPLVPGYLSAITAVEVDRLGERGVARRVVAASVPFALGFTVVFVAARRGRGGARRLGRPGDADEDRRLRARRARARLHGAAALAGALLAPGALDPARGRAARARCSARRSPSARRRASASVLGAILVLGGGLAHGRARAASCSPPTRSGSRSPSS